MKSVLFFTTNHTKKISGRRGDRQLGRRAALEQMDYQSTSEGGEPGSVSTDYPLSFSRMDDAVLWALLLTGLSKSFWDKARCIDEPKGKERIAARPPASAGPVRIAARLLG